MKIAITACKVDIGSIAGHTPPSEAMFQAVHTIVKERRVAACVRVFQLYFRIF